MLRAAMAWLDRLLCPLAALAEDWGALAVVTVLTGIAGGGMLGATVITWLNKRVRTGGGSFGPGWVASVLISLALYLIGLLADPLLKAVVDRPPTIPAEAWARVGFFEWKVLGDWAWPILPLTEHPATGVILHTAFWLVVTLLVRGLLLWLYRDVRIHFHTREGQLPSYYRVVGSSTAKRADQRFIKWMKRLVWVAWPLFLLCGYLLANASMTHGQHIPPSCVEGGELASALSQLVGEPIEGAPWPGAWVLGGMLIFAMSMHLILEGSPPPDEDKSDDEEDEPLPGPPPDPLRRLGDALQAKMPGAFLEALEQFPASEGERAEFPERESPLIAEAFEALTGTEAPYSHQREVLDHLHQVWAMSSPAGAAASPELKEEAGPTPIQRADLSTPHALVLAAEGSGRTTLTCLSALYVHLDRGATTLVILRDTAAAEAWAERLKEALLRSSARWNVSVVVAGDDMADAFLSGRTPAVVVAGLEELEADVLSSPRTAKFFASLGLIVTDDVDRFTGVAEMHLHMIMRRIWTLLDTVHDAPYPPVLLATSGPSASGMAAWARHVLSAPVRVFDRDTAPSKARAVLRRRDLADAHGEAIPLAAIAEACEAAKVPWHRRRAGDAERHLRRADTELGHLRRHHRLDPLEAEVVLLEGTYPDVHREAQRLAHAGLRTEQGSVVLVLAPPGDEEMVLHEEAIDAKNRARIEALPRAVALAEPDLVCQRHFDRALGREQDVEALRSRFGADLTDGVLERLEKGRRVRYREVWVFDPRADDAVSRRLVRASGEAGLGEPVRADCVSESADRTQVIDRGTSETLLELDRAIAAAVAPPGAIFEHPRGRYLVLGVEADGAIECEQLIEPHRTTPERDFVIEMPSPRFERRELGGAPLGVARGDARVEEAVVAIRRYSPGPLLVEQRRYEAPVKTAYSSEVCVVSTVLDGEDPLEEAALVPLAAALRLVLPCALRAAGHLVDVAVAEVEDQRCLVFLDRTPGSSGFSRYIAESALSELLTLARLVLERLVGPVQRRLHRIHDTTHSPDCPPEKWKTGDALAWLDRVLEREADLTSEAEDRRGRRVEFTPGEGKGDLGRLWIASTGRTDDLVWTRHRFFSAHPLGGQPAGAVFLDVAIERRTIAWAIRKARAAGASGQPLQIAETSEWMKQHRSALSTASDDLSALYRRLHELSGPHLVDTVLALVAGIPTHPRPLPVAERAPIAVLARRRADRAAKVLLAWALLPSAVTPTIRLVEEGAVLQITRDGKDEVVDLSGDAIRTVEGDSGAALALSWGEDAPPEATVAEETDDEDPDEEDA